MGWILSPGERGNKKRRPQYRQPAKGFDRDAENPSNRSSRSLDEGGCRHLVSLLCHYFSAVDVRCAPGRGADLSCQLLPRQANPARTGAYAVKTGTDTTAHTNPVNEQGGCPTGLGHRVFDQLVVVDQVLPINDRMTDLDHGKR